MLKIFKYAITGLRSVFTSQRNFRIHIIVAIIVAVAGVFADLSRIEWCIIVLVIFLVLAMEAVNTAIEKLVDLVSPGYLETAGIIKDIAAGAVLLMAIAAVLTGLIIFVPHLI